MGFPTWNSSDERLSSLLQASLGEKLSKEKEMSVRKKTLTRHFAIDIDVEFSGAGEFEFIETSPSTGATKDDCKCSL